MKITQIILSMSLAVIPAFSMEPIEYLAENILSLRRLEVSVSEDQFKKFEAAKKQYFKNFSFMDNLPDEEVGLFEVTNPDNGTTFLALGTNHNLPLECFPKWLKEVIELEVDEIFLESEFVTMIRAFIESSDRTSKLRNEKSTASLLAPLLEIFSTSTSRISLPNIFNIIMGFDAFLGMDSTISMLSLKSKKTVTLLDQPINMTATNLKLLKVQMKEEGVPIPVNDEQLMRGYIDSELSYLFETYMNSEHTTGLLLEDTKGYIEDNQQCLSKKFLADLRRDPEYYRCNTEPRNERWDNLFFSHKSNGRKMMCVGMAHLPDLFERFEKRGYAIKRYNRIQKSLYKQGDL